ncbi:ATP-binding cassette domain-containing protein [Synechococcales cyanobacterium C]|uniref:ATP-binding cassette domain-containing protein n=1 Tax=Petrachloros mirabilis ULC683 TaxID=2781853 RepID=A0A8K1ZYM7_9CYAN|nr:ABC transporter ATP-binding protein [Petrachloros mirabilis]NCJ06401.1 ATP-binding cassette domain-containing protein [Petrachloros mirabilis ULC683]
MTPSVAVSLQHVSKHYNQTPVVNDLCLTIPQGEIFGLLGPNGAGKSTTIRMLTTLTRPTEGDIEVAGFNVLKHAQEVKRRLGVVLQQTSVDRDLTVWENMEFQGRLHHLPQALRQQQIHQYLEYVDLLNRQQDKAKTLSGGMLRRLQIARALLHEPEALFLDEPTVGLDPQSRRRIWEIIQDLNQRGMTLLLTTHYMEEVEALCDRIGIMDMGKLIALGTLAELKQRHGEALVVKQLDSHEAGREGSLRWDYRFFSSLEEAQAFLDAQPNRVGMMVRPANLEDIFVELTGRNLD